MNIVITGSSKGIGLAIAVEFLKKGHSVVISSRTKERVEKVTKELQKTYPQSKVLAFPCDVTKFKEVQALANFAKKEFGIIHYWINNAGTNGGMRKELVNLPEEVIRMVVETNMLGTLFGCKAALEVMVPQKSGHIFNFLGRGSYGEATPKAITYGSTKRAIPHITKTLVKEAKNSGVGVHDIAPGMVVTDLLMTDITPQARKIFNILADRPQDSGEFIVKKMLKIKGTGKKIDFLSKRKIFWRFLTAWTRRNRLFDKEGNYKAD